MGYDIIGDIHGHNDKLIALLRQMGYRERDGCWRHPDRIAIFVGDFIDRGPGQLDTVRTVRSMMDAGSAQAVMGNHEFNAIAWNTPDPLNPGEFLRSHSLKNREQHAAFLGETADSPEQHLEITDWFMTLPLWLELPGLRVVHACWHPADMDELAPYLQSGNRLDATLLEKASRRGTREYALVENILKGPEVTLPDGRSFPQGGQMRRDARVRWWDASATTYRQAAIVDSGTQAMLPDSHIPAGVSPGYDSATPVFFGHYWMSGKPELQSDRVACVDYSVGKNGPLVAYRWDGESNLDARQFVTA